MGLYDIRCKDVARVLCVGAKTLDEIGKEIHKLYSSIDPKGRWLSEVLIKWNPFIRKKNEKYELSELGRALVSLPGREGNPPTKEEKAFLLGTLLLDDRQRKVVCELILFGKSSDKNQWIVNRTKECLKDLGIEMGILKEA